jgi:hypothetical protein
VTKVPLVLTSRSSRSHCPVETATRPRSGPASYAGMGLRPSRPECAAARTNGVDRPSGCRHENEEQDKRGEKCGAIHPFTFLGETRRVRRSGVCEGRAPRSLR